MGQFSRGVATLLLLLFVYSAHAQRSAVWSDPDELYKRGLELFDKKQYASAQKHFVDFQRNTKSVLLKGDAAYYAAACGIELFHRDGEWLMREFIANYPASSKKNSALLYLGRSNFRKKKYRDVIEFFDKVDVYLLEKEELAEFYFKKGYSHVQLGEDEKAKAAFTEIKDVENRYTFPATYYFSHLAYKEKNYYGALGGFNRLLGNETFGGVVPYYITQIYFIQGKYQDVVKEGPRLLQDSSDIQKEAEINRMIGESYFHLQDFKNALVYLQKTDMTSTLNAQGSYVLGYCYYKSGDCVQAARYFERATSANDTLAQSAWYHLGDCQLKQGEKLKAKNAFYSAYQLNADEKIAEDALFSFAKLSYEMDFNPYNEAVKGFTKYLKEYPYSKRKDEVYNYLINVYSTSKNYDQAIRSIESLGAVDPMLKVTYQKLVYFRGVEMFNNNKLDEAEKQFKKSLALNSDMQLNALNQYWLSEISYIRKDYTTAIDGWKKFQLTEGAVSLPEYDLSNYALGYAYFQRKENEDYTNANISFRKFLLTKNTYDEKKIVDATIRTADTYFMNRDFAQASQYYKTAISKNKMDVDYALFQKALCDGLTRNYEQKVAELKKIENNYPKSNYLAASLNELANTYYHNLKDEVNAIRYYELILKNYPNSSFAQNCYAQLGNIYYNHNGRDDDKALYFFDLFVKKDSQSDAAREVLEIIRKIYEAKGDVAGMTKYFESIGNPLSENQIEKAMYTAAYDAFYNQKNCDDALVKWGAYLEKFPSGKYISEANFNVAECAYAKNDYAKALDGYQFIIGRQRSLYTETALSKASYILFKEKNYKDALPLYQQLQEVAEIPSNKSLGRFGAMRCAFYLNRFDVALDECNKVMATEKLTPQQTSEARYIKARSLYETGRLEDAITEFRTITKTAKNVTGAEAYYYIASAQFARKDYKEVVKTINKLISYEYSNDDWNSKAMLLLADTYLAQNEAADAQVILETVIDSKTKQEYVDAATKKLGEIKAAQEQKNAEQSKGQELQLDLNKNKKQADLFNEDQKTEPVETPATGTTVPAGTTTPTQPE